MKRENANIIGHIIGMNQLEREAVLGDYDKNVTSKEMLWYDIFEQ